MSSARSGTAELVGCPASPVDGMTPAAAVAPRPVPPAPCTEPHVLGLDAARVGAALATVWVHSAFYHRWDSSTAAGRFAVPFFAFMAGFFLVVAARRSARSEPWRFLGRRAVRLYVPFLIWTAIFAAAAIVSARLEGGGQPLRLAPDVLLAGTMHHLWFLPFLVMMTALFLPVAIAATASRARALAVGALLVPAGVAMTLWYPDGLLSPEPDVWYFLDRTWHRAPGFLWGLGAALILGTRVAAWRVRWWHGALALAYMAFALGYYWINGRTPICANTAGAAWFVVGLALGSGALARWLAGLAPLTFGVYLCHPLFTIGAFKLAPRLGLPLEGPLAHATVFAWAAVGSLLLVWLVRRLPGGSWVMP